jgi:hypothetical protein
VRKFLRVFVNTTAFIAAFTGVTWALSQMFQLLAPSLGTGLALAALVVAIGFATSVVETFMRTP